VNSRSHELSVTARPMYAQLGAARLPALALSQSRRHATTPAFQDPAGFCQLIFVCETISTVSAPQSWARRGCRRRRWRRCAWCATTAVCSQCTRMRWRGRSASWLPRPRRRSGFISKFNFRPGQLMSIYLRPPQWLLCCLGTAPACKLQHFATPGSASLEPFWMRPLAGLIETAC